MGSRQRRRVVEFSTTAKSSLYEIWHWNAREYDAEHAHRYLEFLHQQISELERRDFEGRPLRGHPSYRYLVIRKNPRGHGHVVVFELRGETVSIGRIFHTAENWQARLKAEDSTE